MDIDEIADNLGYPREETIALINEAIKCKSFFSCFSYDHPSDSRLKLAGKYFLFPSCDHFKQKVNFRLFQYFTWCQIDFHDNSKAGVINKILRRINWLLAEHMGGRLLKTSGLEVSPFAIIERGFWKGQMSNVGMTALSRVGKNVQLGSKVDLVPRPSRRMIAPEIKDGATIWTAAVIVGVKVGENATVGANSVVIEDVPAGATVLGIPAQIVYIKPGSGMQ